jgi:hypothetical protein
MGDVSKKRGRPPGMRAKQIDVAQKLFEHPDTEKVVKEIYTAALDNTHSNQAVAWKILMDRLIPVSSVEKNAVSRESINVIITNVDVPEKVIN